MKNVDNFEVLPDKLEEKQKSNVVSSGWDDTEFSDIEDDDNGDGELIKKEEIVEKKPIEAKPIIKEDKPPQQTKPVEQEQKGWNWYKFGSSILSTASNLTTQLG